MSRSLDGLAPDVRKASFDLLDRWAEDGDLIDGGLIYCTLRSAETQARLYRINRPRSTIERKIDSLRRRGFPRLAELLDDVGPQPGASGKRKTNAGPGESFHQYGLAIDAVPIVEGKLEWRVGRKGSREWLLWQEFGRHGEDAGLEWSGRWTRFKESVHFQRRKPDEFETHRAWLHSLMLEKYG